MVLLVPLPLISLVLLKALARPEAGTTAFLNREEMKITRFLF
jgi:hypothetical protein